MGQTFWEHVRNFRLQLEIIGSNFLQYGSLKRPQFPAEVEFLTKEQLSHSYKILRHSKKKGKVLQPDAFWLSIKKVQEDYQW